MPQTKEEFRKQGKRNRQRGAIFEAKVRDDLKSKGWVVDKFMSTIDFEKNKIVPAKRRYNPFMKALSIGNGFPDFVCFKKSNENYEVIAVEVKINGTLDKKEKQMCKWYLDNEVFSKILIAKKNKIKNKISIEYIDFQDKYYNKLKNI
jgi:hypothetical protein